MDLMIAVDSSQVASFLGELSKAGFEIPEAYSGGWTDRVGGMPLVKARFYVAESGMAGLIVTRTAPIRALANCNKTHSGQLVAQTATCCPFSMSRAKRPRARRLTSASSSA